MRMEEPRLTRKSVIKSVKDLPEDFTVDELMDRILLLAKIERGVADAKAGRSITIDQLEKRMAKWSK